MFRFAYCGVRFYCALGANRYSRQNLYFFDSSLKFKSESARLKGGRYKTGGDGRSALMAGGAKNLRRAQRAVPLQIRIRRCARECG
jgi:hypothetical protein